VPHVREIDFDSRSLKLQEVVTLDLEIIFEHIYIF
jgi:hypothetical protein